MKKKLVGLSSALLSLVLGSSAWANGQTTHLWITSRAIEVLPPGDLAEFLSRPELRLMIDNGTMFPDGGYPVHSPYGEAAHWAPFHEAIRATLPDRRAWNREEEERAAFLFGLLSHGLADEFHDATYMAFSKQEDVWTDEDFDTAADVVFGILGHGRTPPRFWVPTRVLSEAFRQGDGLEISALTMRKGQRFLEAAVMGVGILAQAGAPGTRFRARFPWGMGHLDDPDTLGAPESEAWLVALLFQHLWARLAGEETSMDPPLLASFPRAGEVGHPTHADRVESQIVLVFREGLALDSIQPDAVRVLDQSGRSLPVDLQLFYGNASHTVRVHPRSDWPADQTLTVSIEPGGVRNLQNLSPTEPCRFTFRTAAEQ